MSAPRLTLTFDNGPTPGITDGVLNTLVERGVRATFFVIGSQYEILGARALSERAVAEGHWIGNHTLTHTVQFGEHADLEFGVREIEGAQAAISELAHPDKLFRPYGGGGILSHAVFSRRSVEHLRAEGYTCVLWNSVPHDWDGPHDWVVRAMAHVVAQPWTVVVVHDQDTGAMVHLPEFLDELEREGVEIRQDFPDSCVPIRRGVQRSPLDDLMPLVGAAAR